MSIYITGDTHGAGRDFLKLLSSSLSSLTKDDYIIILGDCGIIFYERHVEYLINLYSYLPFTVLFIDGNHENFDLLNNYPLVSLFEGSARKLSSSVFHLLRGEYYTINNTSFFCFGGGLSYDKSKRVLGLDYWKEELPCKSEYKKGFENIVKNNYQVDFVLTHDCPKSVLKKIKYSMKLKKEGIKCSKINITFEKYNKLLCFKRWYFAHYHSDEIIDDKFTLVYNKIIRLVD